MLKKQEGNQSGPANLGVLSSPVRSCPVLSGQETHMHSMVEPYSIGRKWQLGFVKQVVANSR